jgi:hypothetical protein
MLSASVSALLPGAALLLYKPDRTYAKAIMGAVLYPLTAAVFSILACNDFSYLTVMFVSDACAQSAAPDQPVTPPAQQEEQNIPQPSQEQTEPKPPEAPPAQQEEQNIQQPSQEQTGPKPPEAPPAEPSQPLPEQPSPEQKQPGQEAPKKPEEELKTTIFDILHDWTSKQLLTSATWLDSFFGDQRYLAETNQSYVRFRYNVFLEHESPLLIRPDLQVRIVLPQLKERTHLEFAGTPKETTSLNVTQAPAATDQFTNPGDKSFTAGVSQFLRDTHRVNFVLRAGLQWHQGGPVVILGPRLRLQFPLDHWTFRFIEEDILRNDRGWSAKHTFDLERQLSQALFFRATNDWIQTDHVNGFIYDYIFNIAHPLSNKKALEFEWVNIFQTQPANALTEIDLRIRYRQRIWRDWLYFEVTPQYRFPRDRGFEPTPGILFRLETLFGHL